MAELKSLLDSAAAKSGAESYQECHDVLEQRRELVQQANLQPTEAAKAVVMKQANQLNHPLLNQQMAAYVLLERCAAGERQAILLLDEMAAALKAALG
jgi:hypothetical protein